MTYNDYKQLRRFEFKEGSSNKYWEIQLKDGLTVITHWGRIGTDGAFQQKLFAAERDAQRHYERIVAEKLGKGYREVKAGSMPQAVFRPDTTPTQPATTDEVIGEKKVRRIDF